MCVCVCVSCSAVSDSLWPHGLELTSLLCPWNSPGKNTGVGCHSLLQGILLIQRSNPVLLHCRQILYHLSHRRRPYRFLYFVNIEGILPNIPLSAIPGDFEKGELTYTLLLVYWDSALTALELTSEFLLFSHSVTSESLWPIYCSTGLPW